MGSEYLQPRTRPGNGSCGQIFTGRLQRDHAFSHRGFHAALSFSETIDEIHHGPARIHLVFATLGLSSALFPGVLWAELYGKGAHAADNHPAPTLTKDMLRQASAVAGLEFTGKELDTMLEGAKGNLRASCGVALPQTALAISFPRLRPML